MAWLPTSPHPKPLNTFILSHKQTYQKSPSHRTTENHCDKPILDIVSFSTIFTLCSETCHRFLTKVPLGSRPRTYQDQDPIKLEGMEIKTSSKLHVSKPRTYQEQDLIKTRSSKTRTLVSVHNYKTVILFVYLFTIIVMLSQEVKGATNKVWFLRKNNFFLKYILCHSTSTKLFKPLTSTKTNSTSFGYECKTSCIFSLKKWN